MYICTCHTERERTNKRMNFLSYFEIQNIEYKKNKKQKTERERRDHIFKIMSKSITRKKVRFTFACTTSILFLRKLFPASSIFLCCSLHFRIKTPPSPLPSKSHSEKIVSRLGNVFGRPWTENSDSTQGESRGSGRLVTQRSEACRTRDGQHQSIHINDKR